MSLLRLPFRSPFDHAWMAWFLRTHAAPGVESYFDHRYRTSVSLPHGPALISLRVLDDHVAVEAELADRRDEAPMVARVRGFLDLDADPVTVDRALSVDRHLAPSVAAAPGIRLPGALDADELVLRTMLGQQVSVAAARTAVARLAQALGDPVDDPTGQVTRRFPTAAVVAERGAEVLTGPSRRVRAVVAVAAALADGSLRPSPDRDLAEVRGELLAQPGIGPWTASYVAMRVLRDTDVLLSSDLVVRRGAELVGLDPADTDHLAPWRSYASLHLWRAEVWRRAAASADDTPGHPTGDREF